MPIIVGVSLIIFQFLLIVVHIAVYLSLVAAFSSFIGGIGIVGSGIWLVSLKIIFIILALTFTSASVLTHFYKGVIVDWYYRFAAYWFGLVYFLFIGAVAFYFTIEIFYSKNVYVAPALIGGICFGVAFLIHLYGTWKSQHPEVTEITTPLSSHPGFRADFWKDKKIVFVSDFQLGNIYGSNFAARVAKKIAALDPYVVLIGGDLYDGVMCDEEKLVEPLRVLRPVGGTYFITGNHEYYSRDFAHMIAAVRGIGIKVLSDKKIDIGGIDIVGVDYQSSHKREDFKNALERIGIDRAKPSILLKHEPSDLDVAEAAGISLDLSGHTHRGQIFPLMFFTWQMYKGFDYGLKRLGGMQVFTSSGVGTWGPPLRLGTKSEIVVIRVV
jgi:predicted MPP superfamily phosphohydrolase